MAGFTGYDDVINAVTVNNRMQKLQFSKVLPSTSTAAIAAHTFWKATGLPVAGADPTVGMAGAAKCDSSTAGAMPFTNASGGRTMHLIGLTPLEMDSAGLGTLILVDRLAHANISNDQATASFSPVIDGTDRLGATEGAQIILEVTTQLSAAANTRSFTYTNEAGASHTTPTFDSVASSIVGRMPVANFTFLPLQAGDLGVRTITDTTLSAGTATGAYNIVLVKVLAMIPLSILSIATTRDYVTELPLLQKIADNACLSWYILPNNAGQNAIAGEVRILEN